MIKMRHMLLVAGLAFAGALPLSAVPAAADSAVGVGAHVGDVGVHVGVGSDDHHRDNRYRRDRRHRRDYRHHRRYRHCTSWRWHHHERVCRHWIWRYRH